MEAPLIAYKFLILQHATLKCILESKYDKLINVSIYKVISPKLLRRHSQYTIVAFNHSEAVLANQEILFAFIYRKNSWVNVETATEEQRSDTKEKLLVGLDHNITFQKRLPNKY